MKRLYRSRDERKVAGVCGGLGEYFELDPVLFRLAFILLVFVGGAGVFGYAALWIMVPEKDGAGILEQRRLRRSLAERKIAGICGGLGEYLDVDPVFFRVLFVVLAFIGGLGVLLYIALWIAMPQATGAAPAPGAHEATGSDVH